MEKKANEDADKHPPCDPKLEALIPVLKRELPLKVHSEQFNMITVINIAKEFGCDYTIEHGWACDLYDEELIRGGGSVCLITDGPICGPRTLLVSAGDAVRYGLWHIRALRMITINAAKALYTIIDGKVEYEAV
ncbi:MAG: hypothetical protein LBS19_11680 [Clostridiales bacterium]|jgi:imidazolonepropionase-like amidohydrolase|nr:hypothetical protein [Clostridiales bacterium]